MCDSAPGRVPNLSSPPDQRTFHRAGGTTHPVVLQELRTAGDCSDLSESGPSLDKPEVLSSSFEPRLLVEDAWNFIDAAVYDLALPYLRPDLRSIRQRPSTPFVPITIYGGDCRIVSNVQEKLAIGGSVFNVALGPTKNVAQFAGCSGSLTATATQVPQPALLVGARALLRRRPCLCVW